MWCSHIVPCFLWGRHAAVIAGSHRWPSCLMPEQPSSKPHPHPFSSGGERAIHSTEAVAHATDAGLPPRLYGSAAARDRYIELAVTSNFSFLTGASHPDELIDQAARLGYRAVAITDRSTLAGVVRAHVAARERSIDLVVGSRVSLFVGVPDDPSMGEASIPTASPETPDRAGGFSFEALLAPTCLRSYGDLCRLLTVGKRRAPKGGCSLTLHDFTGQTGLGYGLGDGIGPGYGIGDGIGLAGFIERGVAPSRGERGSMVCTLLPPRIIDHAFVLLVEGIRDAYGSAAHDRLSIAIHRTGDPDDRLRTQQLVALSEWTGVPLVAINDVHYHIPERRPLQDILTCIRHGVPIQRAGYALFPNAERFLKPPAAMVRLFADLPAAVERSVVLAEQCVGPLAEEPAARRSGFSLDQLRYRYPSEVAPPGVTPTAHLRTLTYRGAAERYPAGGTGACPKGIGDAGAALPERVRRQIEHELALIAELSYEPFFLTVHDLVRFARSRDILCQGRGAAANSAVCYCLGITAVDPNRIDVLFERFVSKERNEPPDIDVDFEHERREEVIQYLYRTYGRDRAALTAEVISYRGRSAIRDVGKALGLSLDCVDRLAGTIDWWQEGAIDGERLRELGLDPADPTMRRLAALTAQIIGFPRHLSQHVGGFVITDSPLCELVPIENAAMADRTVIEWDKDDIEAMGMLKVDVLALGMLTCIRKSIDLINADRESATPAATAATAPPVPLRFHTVPPEDPVVYDMICEADTIGVFQIESRAQMSMLPRLRPRCFYDLVIEVAIVRPGPIQGDMVHPYLRRRNGEEPITFPDEAVRRVLGKTLGVPLFQEQAMALAIVAAGFTPGEADQLRRAIGAWKRRGNRLAEFAAKLEQGMIARGYTQQFAQQVFRQIQGFSGYGFPESHAASFALLVYVSCWLKCHHPAAFAAALLNSQPMGFYAPAQIVRDVIEHGIEVRGVDVHASRWDCTLERGSDPAPPTRHPHGHPHGDHHGDHQDTLFPGPRSVRSPDSLRRTPLRINSREQRAALEDPLLCCPVGKRRASEEQLQPALRLGMRLVRGLGEAEAARIDEAVRRAGPFATLRDLWRSSGVRVASLRRLAAADAFRSMGLDRQQALWQVRALRDAPAPLFEQASSTARSIKVDERSAHAPDHHESPPSPSPSSQPPPQPSPAPALSRLPPVPPLAAVAHDYTAVGLSLKRHPLACLRDRLRTLHNTPHDTPQGTRPVAPHITTPVSPCASLRDACLTPQGTLLAVAGVVLVRQRPSTAKGILFMTIEDESGIANLIIRPKVYERFRRAARMSVILLVTGRVERKGDVVHILARRLRNISGLATHTLGEEDIPITVREYR